MTKVVFALLEENTALEIWTEASKAALSDNRIVRGIIDSELGIVSLGTARPADPAEERAIRLETRNPDHALTALAQLPGVRKVAPNFGGLFR